jgi:hypothetical protein
MASTITQPELKLLQSFHANVAKGTALYNVIAAAIVDIEALQAADNASNYKTSVRASATANIASLASASVSQDGVTLVAGDRILLTEQSTASQNGIYVVGTVGGGNAPLTRATDADGSSEVKPGMVVFVSEGTDRGNRWFYLTTDATITLGSTNLVFVKLPELAELASTANAKGASLIGIEDAATNFAATNVETALAEIISDYAATTASNGASKIGIEDAGALYAAATVEAALLEVLTKAAVRRVRGVVYSNQADLNAFTVASDDGITYVEGDRVLLAAQSTGAQNGVYVVGVVGGGTAPLTRAADMPAALALPLGSIVEVGPEGTYYKNSTWKATATTTGGAVIGTNDPLFYPRVWRQTITLAAGTYKIGFGSTATPDEPLFLKSTTESMVNITRDTAGGTLTGTVMYACPVTTRVAGLPGTANIVINSVIEAGTIQNQDTSTLSVLVTNW